MVAPASSPLRRVRLDWKIAFWERNTFSSVWNWAATSSTLAMKP